MSPIRWEFPPSENRCNDELQSRCDDEFLARLESARQSIIQADASAWSTNDPTATIVPESLDRDGLFLLPRRFLEAYESVREASPLGRIFSLANGLHDEIDAVVFVGRQESIAVPQVLIRVCTDRYHNQLSRAERGCKPRAYYVDDRFDNDAVMALLERLKAGGSGRTNPEFQWAIVLMETGDEQSEGRTRIVFETLLSHLPGDAKRYVTGVVRNEGALHRRCRDIGCQEVFTIDGPLDARHRLFSVVTMLPLAMIAQDCIKWLEGAMNVSEEFRDADLKKSRLGTFLFAAHNRFDHFVGSTWTLDQIATCLNRLMIDSPNLRHHPRTPASGNICLTLDEFRHDFLRDHTTQPSRTWPELYETDRTPAESSAARVHVPLVDTHALGQLFQTVLIAAQVFREPDQPSPD
jgi:glucose-6-phosphate isomerase